MLPIAKRRTMNIPHSLAAIAAAICLGLAFVTDFQEREQSLRAELPAPSQVELVIQPSDETVRERAAVTDPQRQVNRDHSSNRSGSRSGSRTGPGLLPWFPVPRNGH